MNPCPTPSRTRGFTLIEAMIALVIVGFGLLALAGLQIVLSRNADVAKQRTEATQLAQAKMDELRAYASITSAGGTPLAWNDIVTTTTEPPIVSAAFSNASFTRTWTVGGAPQDAQRRVGVNVAWIDRAGDPQSVQLDSIIANTDPIRVGALAFPVPSDARRHPLNRHINIPVPASMLVDEGRKTVMQIDSVTAMVFSNSTGLIVEKCNTVVTDTTYAAGTAGCVPFRATLISGFVTALPGVLLPASVPASGPASAPTLPSGVNTNAVTGADTSGGKRISCIYIVAKNQNDIEANLANAHYYLCIIPIATGTGWSGKLRLGGIPTNADYKVCRFQFAPNPALNNNQRNRQPYANVQESLANQNYFVENSPGTTCTPPAVAGATAILHQDCRAAAMPSVTTCPGPTDVTPP